jgi:hypothetical protein
MQIDKDAVISPAGEIERGYADDDSAGSLISVVQ